MITVVTIAKTEERARVLAQWCVCGENAINGELRKSYDVGGRSAEVAAMPLFPATTTPLPKADAVLVAYREPEDAKGIDGILSHYAHVPVKFILYESVEPSPELEKAWNAVKLKQDSPKELAARLVSAHNDLAKLIKKVFDHFDHSHSGFIETKELTAVAKELGAEITEAEAQMLVSELDTDSDGRIGLVEFIDWWRSGRQGRAYRLDELIMGKIQKSNSLMLAAEVLSQYGGLAEVKEAKSDMVSTSFGIHLNRVKTHSGLMIEISFMERGKAYDSYTKELESAVKLAPDALFVAVALGCKKDPKTATAELKEIVDPVLTLLKGAVPAVATAAASSTFQVQVGLSSNNRPILCLSGSHDLVPALIPVKEQLTKLRESFKTEQTVDFYMRLANSLAQIAADDRPWYELLFFDGLSVEFKSRTMRDVATTTVNALQQAVSSLNLGHGNASLQESITTVLNMGLSFNKSEGEIEFEVDDELRKKVKAYIGEGQTAGTSVKVLKEKAAPRLKSAMEDVPLAAKAYNLFKDNVSSMEIFVSYFDLFAIKLAFEMPGLGQLMNLD